MVNCLDTVSFEVVLLIWRVHGGQGHCHWGLSVIQTLLFWHLIFHLAVYITYTMQTVQYEHLAACLVRLYIWWSWITRFTACVPPVDLRIDSYAYSRDAYEWWDWKPSFSGPLCMEAKQSNNESQGNESRSKGWGVRDSRSIYKILLRRNRWVLRWVMARIWRRLWGCGFEANISAAQHL